MNYFNRSNHHGHGHHRHERHHKKERHHGRKFGKRDHHHYHHMENELWSRRRNFATRSLSETDIAGQGADVQKQIRQIVQAFFNRRHHWGRGRWHFEHRAIENAEGAGHSAGENDEGKVSTEEEPANERGQHRWRRHHFFYFHGGIGSNSQGRNTDGENDSGTEGKEQNEGNIRSSPGRKHHHRRHGFHGKRHHGREFWYGRNQGRSTEEGESSSSSSDDMEMRNKHCTKRMKKHHHGKHGFKHHFKHWKRHGYCANLVDASTMTDDRVEEPNQAVSNGDDQTNQVMQSVEDNQEASQGPSSPEIQEVADNLEKSSLE